MDPGLERLRRGLWKPFGAQECYLIGQRMRPILELASSKNLSIQTNRVFCNQTLLPELPRLTGLCRLQLTAQGELGSNEVCLCWSKHHNSLALDRESSVLHAWASFGPRAVMMPN